MAYCTQQDLRQEYRDLDEFEMISEDVDAFIAKSAATIDSHLALSYSVPFTAVPSTPPIIREIAKDLSLVYIFTRHYTQEKRNSSDWVNQRREDAFDLLERLSDANDSLSIVTSSGLVIGTSTTQQQILGQRENDKPVFDMRDLIDQRIDPDRLEAENAEDT